MMDACFNSHAIRQFENDEADQERRAIAAEDAVMWQFAEDCKDPDKLAAIIEQYEVDMSPLLSLIFKPLAHNDLAAGRITDIRNRVGVCFHRYIADQVQKELDK